jgi:tRNA nucleotidyltransferase (CCA-adding enzyme)
MAKVPKQFVDQTLWPEYTELNNVLRTYLDETTERVIGQGVYADSSEAEVIKALPRA